MDMIGNFSHRQRVSHLYFFGKGYYLIYSDKACNVLISTIVPYTHITSAKPEVPFARGPGPTYEVTPLNP